MECHVLSTITGGANIDAIATQYVGEFRSSPSRQTNLSGHVSSCRCVLVFDSGFDISVVVQYTNGSCGTFAVHVISLQLYLVGIWFLHVVPFDEATSRRTRSFQNSIFLVGRRYLHDIVVQLLLDFSNGATDCQLRSALGDLLLHDGHWSTLAVRVRSYRINNLLMRLGTTTINKASI
jgi:hypothetical protein